MFLFLEYDARVVAQVPAKDILFLGLERTLNPTSLAYKNAFVEDCNFN